MSLWNPLKPHNIKDPYPMYELIRSEASVYKAQTDEYIITGYELTKQILKDSEQFKAGNGKVWMEKGVEYFKTKDISLKWIAEAIDSFILLINPPEHTELRRFISKAWHDHHVDQIISENCKILLDDIENSRFDFIEKFAKPLPALTITKILGLDTKDYLKLQQLGSQMVKSLDFYLKLDDLIRINEAAKAFIELFKSYIKNPPKVGLISKIVTLNAQRDEPFPESRLISICIFLFVAGEETSVSLLSTGLKTIIENDLWEDLETNTEEIVDEVLRYNGPVHLLGRITAKDSSLDGILIPANSTITLCLAAANRDPKVFQTPDQFQLGRKERNLAFGSGNHYCLGDWLAKKQANIAFSFLKKHFTEVSLDNRTYEWKNQLAIRRLNELWINVKQ